MSGVRRGRLRNLGTRTAFGETEPDVACRAISVRDQPVTATSPSVASSTTISAVLNMRSCGADTFSGSSMASGCAL